MFDPRTYLIFMLKFGKKASKNFHHFVLSHISTPNQQRGGGGREREREGFFHFNETEEQSDVSTTALA